MKKKLCLLITAYLAVTVVVLPFYSTLSVVLLILLLLSGFICLPLLILNKLYKKTNHWKNQFAFQKNFISNVGYRENISRGFDVVNLGSNPALFGFFYEKIRGQNWSTGSQGLAMDFEILKYFHSYIKEGGFVLLPIMPFTSISQYLKTKADYWSSNYYLKFASILDISQALKLPYGRKLIKFERYPVLFNLWLTWYVFHDVERDNRLLIAEQNMSSVELEQDARIWINNWMKEFDVKTIDGFFEEKFFSFENEGIDILKQMIDFCNTRNLKPVLITVPMSSYLAKMFPVEFRKRMIDDFVEKSTTNSVLYLDYMFDKRFNDAALYNGSFFLNLRGRKLFTNQVMKDLGL